MVFSIKTNSNIERIIHSFEVNKLSVFIEFIKRNSYMILRDYYKTFMTIYNSSNFDFDRISIDLELKKPLAQISDRNLEFISNDNSNSAFITFRGKLKNNVIQNIRLNTIITNKNFILLSHSKSAKIISLFIDGVLDYVLYGTQAILSKFDFITDNNYPNSFSRLEEVYQEFYKDENNVKKVYLNEIPEPSANNDTGILVKMSYPDYVRYGIITAIYEYEDR